MNSQESVLFFATIESLYLESLYHHIAVFNMGKNSRRRQQRKRYEDFLNEEGSFTFDGDDSDGALHATFAHILFIQVFSLFLYYASLLDDLTFGCKEKETKQDRKPVEQGGRATGWVIISGGGGGGCGGAMGAGGAIP